VSPAQCPTSAQMYSCNCVYTSHSFKHVQRLYSRSLDLELISESHSRILSSRIEHSLRDGWRRVRTFGSARVTKAQLMAWEWPWAWKPGSHTATRRSSGPAGPPTGQSMPSVRIHGPAMQATRRRGPWRVSAYQTPSGRRPGDGCGGVVYYTWVWYVGAAPRCGCVRWASTSGGRRQRCIQLCGVTLP
jgi:hypothetical protein